MRYSIILPFVAIAAVLSSCSQAQGPKIPLDMSAPRPMVEFNIPGHDPMLAVFDTGAGGNAFDRAFAVEANLPNLQPVGVGSGAGGEPIEGFLTNIDTMFVGEVELHDVMAVVIDLPKPPGHEAMTAVIGPNIFAGRYVTLDFASEALLLHDKDGSYTPKGEEAAYSKEARPLPAIPVTIGGEDYAAHIDTGAPRTLTLPFELADSLPLDGAIEEAGVARVVTGERKLYKGKLQGTVKVGPLTFENPEVEFLEGLRNVNVGMTLLRDLSITLDPEEQKLWITKAR